MPTDWRRDARQILVPFVAGGIALLAWAMQSDAIDAFGFPRQRPVPWAVLLVTLEHGLWGDWLFTLGFGRYLYGGHA